jgi:hypothetical protein
MLKLALLFILNTNTNTAPRYTLADLKANNPYTLRDYADRPPLYTDKEFERALEKQNACQCIVLRVSSSGAVVGTSRVCACEE